jgi:hypothetical protein
MSSIHTLVEIFTAAPTLANAKKIVAKVTHHPMSTCLLLADGAAQVGKAKALVASVTPLAAATTCKIAEAADKIAEA